LLNSRAAGADTPGVAAVDAPSAPLSLLGARVVPSLLYATLACSQVAAIPDEVRAAGVADRVLSAAVWLMFLGIVQVRPAPVLRNRNAVGVVAALFATAPTIVPGALGHTASAWPLVVGDVLILGGLVFALTSVGFLGRCFGVLPDARGLVTGGPYRIVRHPLYLGEIVAILGMTVASSNPALAGAALIVLAVTQAVRARYEEATLRAAFPGYADYAARTRFRIFPGLY
jgi:protein-S-isoprenylcysteine O-methyltransferase Ste14